MGSNPAGGTYNHDYEEKINEKKLKKMEKERPDEMEMAEKKDEEREKNES